MNGKYIEYKKAQTKYTSGRLYRVIDVFIYVKKKHKYTYSRRITGTSSSRRELYNLHHGIDRTNIINGRKKK